MKVFEKKIHLRVGDYDLYDNLIPQAVFDIFQDAAGEHADKIGVGYEALRKKDTIWVLLRNRFDVIENPPFYAEVTVKTWPHEKGRADFDRDYLIMDEEGKVLVKGSSKWCLCNFVTRKIVFGNQIEYDLKEFCQDKNYPEGLKKIANFSEECFESYTSKTAFCDLDHNGHVNNAKYANFILNALRLKEDEHIKTFEIDYIKEMPKDSEFTVYYKKIEGVYFVKCVAFGEASDSFEVFRAKVTV